MSLSERFYRKKTRIPGRGIWRVEIIDVAKLLGEKAAQNIEKLTRAALGLSDKVEETTLTIEKFNQAWEEYRRIRT